MSKKQYTVREVAELIGLSEYMVRKKIREGEIEVLKKDGKIGAVTREEINEKTKGNPSERYQIPHSALMRYCRKAFLETGQAASFYLMGDFLPTIMGDFYKVCEELEEAQDEGRDVKKLKTLAARRWQAQIDELKYKLRELGREAKKETPQKSEKKTKSRVVKLMGQIGLLQYYKSVIEMIDEPDEEEQDNKPYLRAYRGETNKHSSKE